MASLVCRYFVNRLARFRSLSASERASDSRSLARSRSLLRARERKRKRGRPYCRIRMQRAVETAVDVVRAVADDTAPSTRDPLPRRALSAMQVLLYAVEDHGEQLHISFGIEKCQLLCRKTHFFGGRSCPNPLTCQAFCAKSPQTTAFWVAKCRTHSF